MLKMKQRVKKELKNFDHQLNVLENIIEFRYKLEKPVHISKEELVQKLEIFCKANDGTKFHKQSLNQLSYLKDLKLRDMIPKFIDKLERKLKIKISFDQKKYPKDDVKFEEYYVEFVKNFCKRKNIQKSAEKYLLPEYFFEKVVNTLNQRVEFDMRLFTTKKLMESKFYENIRDLCKDDLDKFEAFFCLRSRISDIENFTNILDIKDSAIRDRMLRK